MTSCRFEFFLSYILKVDFTHLWWTQAIWCCDHRLSGQESIYGPAKLKLYFKKILRHSGEMEFNIYQFHMEIKCILKLTSPNQIKRKCNNYSTQYIVRFLKKKKCWVATIKPFEMLISKPWTPLWVKENKCKSSWNNWKPECSFQAQPVIGATCRNLKLLSPAQHFLSLCSGSFPHRDRWF